MAEGSFARNHLEKYGWETGKGLGRTETGITDAIKPKLKFDTAGIGHDAGEQFSFHWWDHVFNKAAKNIHVENNEEGVKVKQKGTKSSIISNKRSTHVNKTKPLLYGSFVKHGTLTDGSISQDKDCSSSSSSDESDDDKPPDTYEGNDEMLFNACGGRTAHKGARHGLHLSGKLQRIEEQESLHSNMMKMRNGSKATPTNREMERVDDGLKVEKRKRHKHKKLNKERDESDDLMETIETPEVMDRLEVQNVDDTAPERKKNKKNKKSKKGKELSSLDSRLDGHEDEVDNSSSLLDCELNGGEVSLEATNTRKKKSKKIKKAKEEMEVKIEEEESEILVSMESALVEQPRKKKSKKERKRVKIEVESVNSMEEESVKGESPSKKEKKHRKKKKSKSGSVADEFSSDENRKKDDVETDEEVISKKSKRKDRKKHGKRHMKEEDEVDDVTSAFSSRGEDICQVDTVSKKGSKKKKTRKSGKDLPG